MKHLVLAGALLFAVSCAAPAAAPRPALGGRLAYVAADGSLRLAGVPRPLAQGVRTPRWSPSGRWLAWAEGESGLVLYDAAGGGARRAAAAVRGFAWSPAADLLAIDSGGLALLSPGGAPRLLVAGPVTGLAWSPDGRRLAFAQPSPAGDAILSVAVEGGAAPELLLPANGEGRSLAAWSPPPVGLLYWADPGQRRGPGELALESLDLGAAVASSRPDPAAVAVSAAGARLAFVTAGGLWVARADGKARRRLAGADAGSAAQWSRDGSRLLLSRRDGLWLLPAAGGPASRAGGPALAIAWTG